MIGPRRQAREAALQILYFWEVGRADPEAAEDVVAFASTLVLGTIAEIAELDAMIAEHSAHWRVERLAVLDRLILRMAVWELRHAADTPAPVAINEAIELARRFSTPDAVRFVNGVLDGIRRSLDLDGTGER